MKYAAIKKNDIVNGEGVCVSLWTQGCPFHCHGCHNPETWNFDGGKEDSVSNIIKYIKEAICANGIQRNFSILGGEPLCDENLNDVQIILKEIKKSYSSITTFVWTGYTKKELIQRKIDLSNIDILIVGRYIEQLRDITLHLRGSSNQQILHCPFDFNEK